MKHFRHSRSAGWWLLLAGLALTLAAYWSGLYGSWLFDDYPNIVDNSALQIHHLSIPDLAGAALSSPSSQFKRPLASLSFALNYYVSGMDPFAMKLTNVVIHLLNGVLVFLLVRMVLRVRPGSGDLADDLGGGGLLSPAEGVPPSANGVPPSAQSVPPSALRASSPASGGRGFVADSSWASSPASGGRGFVADSSWASSPASGGRGFVADSSWASPAASGGRDAGIGADDAGGGAGRRIGIIAALVAGAWMLLPINLTAVLYVVQRMESLANLCVLAGLIGYVAGRMRMWRGATGSGWLLAAASIVLGTGIGFLFKETAVMLSLYAFAVEWIVLGFRTGPWRRATRVAAPPSSRRWDWRVIALFIVVLVLPLAVGLAWQIPKALNPAHWASRSFDLHQRLLSELRIVLDYIGWTLVPTPDVLSFYHDDFVASTGFFTPWTTAASALGLAVLIGAIFALRRRAPLVSLGLALFFGCQLLTGTFLDLELIYEHRNYFASFGLMLALVPWLVSGRLRWPGWRTHATAWTLPRYALLAGLLAFWASLTALTAYDWGDPLRLAQTLAARNPDSPRAQYGLGRRYIMYSDYDPNSVFTTMAYTPLEKAMRLPRFSVLPEQALIFMNARMHLPLKDEWWQSMDRSLRNNPLGVQDVSALASLATCQREGDCKLPKQRMVQAFLAALSHPHPRPRLLAVYSDYAWNVLDDRTLGLRMAREAVHAKPGEPNYRITLIRMLVVMGDDAQARHELDQLKTLNTGGRLDGSIANLKTLLDEQGHPSD